MTEDEQQRRYGSENDPSPMTVAQLRERLAGLPDDAILRFPDYQTPEFSDWYTDVRHLSAVKDDGTLVLRSNVDYITDRDEDDEWQDDDEVEDEEAQNARAGAYTPPAQGPDGLYDWERELIQVVEGPADQPSHA